jgi:hypothetical protein
MSSPSVDENKIWEDDTQGLTCGALPRESVITVTVTDAQSGVNQVRASWTIEGQSGGVTLSPSGSTYAGTFGSFPYLTIPDNTDQIIPIIVTATDNAGNETKDSTAVRLHSTATCFG